MSGASFRDLAGAVGTPEDVEGVLPVGAQALEIDGLQALEPGQEKLNGDPPKDPHRRHRWSGVP